MKNTIEYKILKHLKENDSGEYVDISMLFENKKLLKSKLIELRDSKLIKTNFGEYHINGISTPCNFLVKITINGNEYLNEIEKESIINNGIIIQDSSFKNSPIKNKVNAEPNNKPEQKSFVKKFFSNPYVIGSVLIVIEEIKFGFIMDFIVNWFE
jgi:hypothetical protein